MNLQKALSIISATAFEALNYEERFNRADYLSKKEAFEISGDYYDFPDLSFDKKITEAYLCALEALLKVNSERYYRKLDPVDLTGMPCLAGHYCQGRRLVEPLQKPCNDPT